MANTTSIQDHLQALRAFAEDAGANRHQPDELKVKQMQLQAVQKTIRQLERKTIPVPEGLTSEKLALATAVGELEKDTGIGEVYESLLDIVERLGRTCGRRPHHELYLRLRERRRQTTPPEVLRKELLRALEELGGSARERDILPKVETRLAGQFTPADLERPQGRRARWQINLRRERRRMIDNGLLTPESRGGRPWTLRK